MKLQFTFLSILVLLVLGSCEKKSPTPNPAINQSIGDLVFSEFKEVSRAQLAVNHPSTELEVKDGATKGTKLFISPGAFQGSSHVKISEANVVSHNYANNKPLSPLIRIESDGENISSGMKLSIPINLGDNEFASAFVVTDDGKLHILPLLDLQANRIDVAIFDLNYNSNTSTATHRSSSYTGTLITIIVLVTNDSELREKEVSSTYEPGVDDWEFENLGSVVTPRGNCLGMTLSSLWYHQFEKRNSGPLYGRKEWGLTVSPNSTQPGTHTGSETKDGLWFDNTLGIKFVSILQEQQNTAFSKKVYNFYNENFGKDWTKPIRDRHIFNLVAHHFSVSNEPMLLSVSGDHAVLVIEKKKDRLIIADPNFPGTKLTLTYTPLGFGKLRSAIAPDFYNEYSDFYILPWRGVLPIENIKIAWQELLSGTIGRPIFPITEFIAISEGKSTKLATGAINEIKTQFKVTHAMDSICLFKTNGDLIYKNGEGYYSVDKGVNKIGILALTRYNGASSGRLKYRWTDFKWFDVNVVEETEPTVSDTSMIKGFKVRVIGFPQNSNFSITGNGRIDSKTFDPIGNGFHNLELSLAVGEHTINVDQDQKFYLNPQLGFNLDFPETSVRIGNYIYQLEVYHFSYITYQNYWLIPRTGQSAYLGNKGSAKIRVIKKPW